MGAIISIYKQGKNNTGQTTPWLTIKDTTRKEYKRIFNADTPYLRTTTNKLNTKTELIKKSLP